MSFVLIATLNDQAQADPSRTAPVTAAAAAESGPPCPVARPDEAAAKVSARLCRGRVEVANLRSETRLAWANPDGSMSLEVAAVPQRIRRDDGRWADIDLALRPASGGLRPAASAADLTFSPGGTGPLVTMKQTARAMTLSWPERLPAPVVTGDSATYGNVLPDVDLVMRATRTGFASVFVVKTPAAAANPRLRSIALRVGGDLRLARAADGGLVATAAGRVVATAPPPVMWDSSLPPSLAKNAAASTIVRPGDAAKVRPVGTRVTANGDLVLVPDPSLLSGPGIEYPLFIDPSFSTTSTKWAYATSTNVNGATDGARVGRDSTDGKLFRSFFDFGISALAGKQILTAVVGARLDHSWSCAPTPTYLYRTGAITVASAGRMPWTTYPLPGSSAFLASALSNANGSGSCGVPQPDMNVDFSSSALTNNVQLAASAMANTFTVGMCACDSSGGGETNQDRWKRWYTGNTTLIVVYNSQPTVGTRSTAPPTACVTGTGRPYINTATPQLNGQVNDPDGGSVSAEFEWWAVGGAAKIGSTTTATAPAGSTLSAAVPAGAFSNGGDYRWRVRGTDSLMFTAWSTYCEFTVDTVAPGAAPGVASTTYPEGTWSGAAGTPGTFTFSAGGVTDVASYVYGLDANPPTTAVAASAIGGTAAVSITPSTNLPHTLYVQSVDRAGNRSPVRAYQFNVGSGGVLVPRTGDMSAAKFALQSQGQSGATGVTYQWRRGDADTWATIPAAHATVAAGGAPVTWPQATSGGGAFAKLNWDAAATLMAAEGGSEPRSGPLQVRATFTGAGTSSEPVKVTFDLDRAWATTEEAGPGSVNLLTGNLGIGQTDVALAGLGLTRTYNSRRPGDLDPMYGPGWISSILAEPDPGYTELTVAGSLVQVGLPDGAILGFAKQSGTATAATYAPQIGAEGFGLSWTANPDRFTLTDLDGNVVLFTRPSGGAAGLYIPTSLTAPGSANTTTVSWELVPGSTTQARPTRVLSPVPAGVSCATLVRGCKALTFAYASTTTATGTGPTAWGDYAQRLTRVEFAGWDPDASPAAMRTVVIARFQYDSNGRLRASWDPRLDWLDTTQTPAVTRPVRTVYDYDGNGVISALTPPGQEPWAFGYTTVPGDSGLGRLASVSRSALAAGTAVSTVVYRVPVSGAGAPYDLSAGQTARWGQTEAPTDAAAVFPPTQIPTGNQAAGTLPSSYERAAVTYLDANGRTVNTVAPGGGVDTTWFDMYGHVTGALTATNRARALNASPTDTPAQEAVLADARSSRSVYSADGQRLLTRMEPEHDVVLTNGSLVRGRRMTTYTYDQGAPAGGPYNLVTTRVESVAHRVGGVEVSADARTSTIAYDWTLRTPTIQTVDPAGLALTTRNEYDADGRITAETAPAGGATTNTPATRKTVYYTAAANATYPTCGGRAEWHGLACRTFPGGQAATGPELAYALTTYDLYGQIRRTEETTSAGILRTTVVDRDGAGRPVDVTITAAAGLGVAVPKTRTVYDPRTGFGVRTQSLDGGGNVAAEVVRVYDTVGRLTSYTDADGSTATTTYDLASRIATQTDGKATRTFTYDGGSERRGLATQVVDTGAGTFTATYGVEGTPTEQTWPNGVVVRTGLDETGTPVTITYDKPGCGNPAGCELFVETLLAGAHGHWIRRDSTLSEQTYGYDGAGRLTTVEDTVGGACTTRVYGFVGTPGKASNRTALTTFDPAGGGGCQTVTATSSRGYTYDTADRLTTAGTVYDTLGRTLTTPAGDTLLPGGGNATMTYHTNDMVRTIAQNGVTGTYTLDVVTSRFRSWTDNSTGGPLVRTNHYTNDGDSPAWTNEGDGTWTRFVEGLDWPAAIQAGGASGAVVWQITNLHGDLVAEVDGSPGLSSTGEYTEYGSPRDAGTVGERRYGWLGAAQRVTAPNGSMAMGRRLYSPAVGRFGSVDPIYGGNANGYEYCKGDGINCADTTGCVGCAWHGTIYRDSPLIRLDLYVTAFGFKIYGYSGVFGAWNLFDGAQSGIWGVAWGRTTVRIRALLRRSWWGRWLAYYGVIRVSSQFPWRYCYVSFWRSGVGGVF
jgi:RHS repeat-associated protein